MSTCGLCEGDGEGYNTDPDDWDYQPVCGACGGSGIIAPHVYKPLHTFPNSVGIGFGPCQHPGCTAEKNSVVHGALELGITRKVESDHGPEPR